MLNLDLFDDPGRDTGESIALADGALALCGAATSIADTLLAEIHAVEQQAPFRSMITPGGYTMSVATTSCGRFGWVSDAHGYRYSPLDPDTGKPWPSMPTVFTEFATECAARAGFHDFLPDACLINRYVAGSRLSLHQDRNERDMRAPIVSVSLGLPAVFLFGGLKRNDPTRRFRLSHGDVVVWGGPARLRFHGVLALKDGWHPATERCRINLTFRKAG